jgi:hypothetical protein
MKALLADGQLFQVADRKPILLRLVASRENAQIALMPKDEEKRFCYLGIAPVSGFLQRLKALPHREVSCPSPIRSAAANILQPVVCVIPNTGLSDRESNEAR